MTEAYTYTPLERVYWDAKVEEALLKEVDLLDLKKVFVVASSTLSNKTKEISKIQEVIGENFVGFFDLAFTYN